MSVTVLRNWWSCRFRKEGCTCSHQESGAGQGSIAALLLSPAPSTPEASACATSSTGNGRGGPWQAPPSHDLHNQQHPISSTPHLTEACTAEQPQRLSSSQTSHGDSRGGEPWEASGDVPGHDRSAQGSQLCVGQAGAPLDICPPPTNEEGVTACLGAAPLGKLLQSDSHGGRECWNGEGVHITVQEHPGQVLQVRGVARVPLPPQQLFMLITHPSNERIFRHLDTCEDRRVIVEGGREGATVVESEHLASWRVLLLAGTLRTRLRVEQRPQEGSVQFTLLPSSSQLMRRFEGVWRVVEEGTGRAAPAELAAQRTERALLSLEQWVQPAVYLPPPLGLLFKSIACRQLRGIFEDVQVEAAQIKKGRPSLW